MEIGNLLHVETGKIALREKINREIQSKDSSRSNDQVKLLHKKHSFTIIASNFVRKQSKTYRTKINAKKFSWKQLKIYQITKS